jgi:hypothetical protein
LPADGQIRDFCQRRVHLEQVGLGDARWLSTRHVLPIEKEPAAEAVPKTEVMNDNENWPFAGRDLRNRQGGNIDGIIPGRVFRSCGRGAEQGTKKAEKAHVN